MRYIFQGKEKKEFAFLNIVAIFFQLLAHCTASRQWACQTEARLQSWQQSGPCGPAADLTADLAADPTADLAADLTADPTADLTADLAADLSYHAWWANNASVNVKSCWHVTGLKIISNPWGLRLRYLNKNMSQIKRGSRYLISRTGIPDICCEHRERRACKFFGWVLKDSRRTRKLLFWAPFISQQWMYYSIGGGWGEGTCWDR